MKDSFNEKKTKSILVELYGILREDFSGGRMREARAEIKAEFPPGEEGWKINQGEYLDLTNIQCEIHWLQREPQTKGLGSIQNRRLKLEWWYVLPDS
jgi:hypothetical protein